MSAEYAEFDGTPMRRGLPWTKERHDWFFSDAYRTAANIGLDYEWCKKDVGQCAAVKRLQYHLGVTQKGNMTGVFEVDGTPIGSAAKHPLGIIATTAQGALALDGPISLGDEDKEKALAAEWVKRLWDEPMRPGKYRYYDNCLYVFAFLALSGNYRIYE